MTAVRGKLKFLLYEIISLMLYKQLAAINAHHNRKVYARFYSSVPIILKTLLIYLE